MITILRASKLNLSELSILFDAYRVFYQAKTNVESAYVFLSDRIKNQESAIFIAYIDDQAVGFTQIYPMFSSVSMQRMYVLNDLFVSPTHRGKGVGEALLNRGKEYTIANQGKSLILETSKDNPAQHLYERLGWQKDVEYLHYSWIPSI